MPWALVLCSLRINEQRAAVEGAFLQLADMHTAQEGLPDFQQLR